MPTLKVKMTKYEHWEAKIGTQSFTPLEILDLQDAVRNREASVTLDDKYRGHRVFLLTYTDLTFHYQPERDFAPRGTLTIKRFLEG